MGRPRNPQRLFERKLTEIVYEGREVSTANGQIVRVTASAGDFANLLKYLQVTGRITKTKRPTAELVAMHKRAQQLGLKTPGVLAPGEKRGRGRPRLVIDPPVNQPPPDEGEQQEDAA